MASFSAILDQIQAIGDTIDAKLQSSGNAPVLMSLGSFKFSLNTLVFQEVNRSTEYGWAFIERFGQLDAAQYTGHGEERIELPGQLYPDFRGNTGQIDLLKQIASTGKPQRLMDSGGNVLGMWAILKIDDSSSNHTPAGDPRKIDFVVSLKKVSDDADL